MTTPANPSCESFAPDPAEDRATRYAAILDEIVALGMVELRRVMSVPQEVDDDGRVDLAREKLRIANYNDLTAGLRRNVALGARMEGMAKKAAEKDLAERIARTAKAAERRREVAAAVTPAIEGSRRPRCELDRVWEEFSEWLDERDDDPDFTEGDVFDQAEQACEELNLTVQRVMTRRYAKPPRWSLEPGPAKGAPPRLRVDIRGPPDS